LLDEAKGRYPTTLREDLNILKRDSKKSTERDNQTLTKNEKNCIIYRKSEKEFL
jgi:hypothetical protein